MRTRTGSVLSAASLIFLVSSSIAAPDPSQLAESCTSCHGPGGASVGPATPVLAGLSRNYLLGSLLAYKFADDLSASDTIIEENPLLEDVVVLGRPATIMEHIARGYSVEEIQALADYFSDREFVRDSQTADPDKAKIGRTLHNKYCGKCHQDGGRSGKADTSILAGQWKPYLTYTLTDFLAGDRQMTKKKAERMTELRKKAGDQAIPNIIDFYISQ